LINIDTGFRKFWWISWISIFRPTDPSMYFGAVCGAVFREILHFSMILFQIDAHAFWGYFMIPQNEIRRLGIRRNGRNSVLNSAGVGVPPGLRRCDASLSV